MRKNVSNMKYPIGIQTFDKIVDDGYIYVVDLDLERFFDTVSHSKLIEILSRTIKDGRVISLIHKYPAVV